MTKAEQYCYDQGRGELKSIMNQLKACREENAKAKELIQYIWDCDMGGETWDGQRLWDFLHPKVTEQAGGK